MVYIVVLLIGIFIGAFIANKTFRDKIVNGIKKLPEGDKAKRKVAK
jgi:uncharacterized protein YneF (UPF0154 family)